MPRPRARRTGNWPKILSADLLPAGFHLPGTAIGSLVRRGDGYDFIPLAD
jgi:hypothetical protein